MATKPYKKLQERRNKVILYIKTHKNATTKEVKTRTGIKVERTFKHGIREAYKLADVELPKRLLKRNKESCKRLAINYVKNNPKCTISEIQSKLRINIWRLFGGIENLFKEAKVPYPRKKIHEKLRRGVVNLIKKNPYFTSQEIHEKMGVSIYSIFKNMQEVYKLANVKPVPFREKRKIKKQDEVVSYIIKHPETTQWEINKGCKTHVQELFDGGIRGAFEKAGIEYPESRRILYGTAKLSIKRRSLIFQKRVVNLLKRFGKVNEQVRTKNGIVDVVFYYKKQIIPIEIKDYRSKPISNSEVKQMEKYLNDLKCNFGIIISSKGRRKEFKLGSNKIIKVIPIKYMRGYLGLWSNLVWCNSR